MHKMLRALSGVLFCQALCLGTLAAQDSLQLNPHDKVVVIGNTLAERLQYSNDWETLLHTRFPKHELVVRNLGWSADTINVRLRSLDFPDHDHTLFDHQPHVILAMFGTNESFAGPQGIEQFKHDLAQFIDDLRQLKYPTTEYDPGSFNPRHQDKQGTVEHEPKLVFCSPIPHEDLPERHITAGTDNNENLQAYAEAMKQVAADKDVRFVDVFAPMQKVFAEQSEPLTINGMHLNDRGQSEFAQVLDTALFGDVQKIDEAHAEKVRAEVAEKNLQFYYDYRAVNGYYIYGGRKNPYGVVNFPAEFEKLRKMVAVRDQRVWDVAQNKEVSEKIDDSGTGGFADVVTNFQKEIHITSPEEALETFTLPDGFKAELWASEEDFPDLENPVQFTFDAQGRLWITTMPSYPMYLPGHPVDDRVLILSDTNSDGKADNQKIFARGLHLPGGIELGDGGAYVAEQPNLMFIKDTDGDEQADKYELVLHGFDSADSHHSISAFEWGPGGELYFQEGTFHHSQIETPQGPRRLTNAGVFRYEPRTSKLDVYISYNFANPWGHAFDKWGQNFIADASGGANYFAAPFSGDLDFPRKHPGMRQFLDMQWRPTAGCEFVSSSNFPKEMQGDYLLNNCIGFQGVLQYRVKEVGSGFFAEPVTPLLRSSDPNFRPVDLQFGPDGALYVLDWFNPLVGHMQHSLRDPNRDKTHGRVWKISYTGNDLVEPAKIAGEPLPALLELLKTYEDRTRFRVRRELRDRPTEEVLAAIDKWIVGLDSSADNYEHLLLEALWVQQHHDAVDQDLLKQLLAAKDGHARAAAVRVLCYTKDRVDEPLTLLQAAVNDEHPRVRLEAIRALSFYDEQRASDIAVESLIYDQDDYLEYTLKETLETLQQRIDKKAKTTTQAD